MFSYAERGRKKEDMENSGAGEGVAGDAGVGVGDAGVGAGDGGRIRNGGMFVQQPLHDTLLFDKGLDFFAGNRAQVRLNENFKRARWPPKRHLLTFAEDRWGLLCQTWPGLSALSCGIWRYRTCGSSQATSSCCSRSRSRSRAMYRHYQ